MKKKAKLNQKNINKNYRKYYMKLMKQIMIELLKLNQNKKKTDMKNNQNLQISEVIRKIL